MESWFVWMLRKCEKASGNCVQFVREMKIWRSWDAGEGKLKNLCQCQWECSIYGRDRPCLPPPPPPVSELDSRRLSGEACFSVAKNLLLPLVCTVEFNWHPYDAVLAGKWLEELYNCTHLIRTQQKKSIHRRPNNPK